MTDQERLAWIEQQLQGRELQHKTFKRDRDEITLSISDVRFLVNRTKLMQGIVDALSANPGSTIEIEEVK